METQDYLFLEVFSELRWRLNIPSSYNVVRSAGLARMLLLDRRPFLHEVNKLRRLKIGFHCGKSAPIALEGDITYCPICYDSSAHPLTLDEFLGVEVIKADKCVVSIRNIIKFLSNKWGGIHYETPVSTPEDKLLLQIDETLMRGGANLIVRLMWGLGAVILKDLLSLQQKVWASYRTAMAPGQDRIFGHWQADKSPGFAYTFGGGHLQNTLSKSLERGFSFCSVIKLIPNEHCSGVLYETEDISTKQKILVVRQQNKDLVISTHSASESIMVNDIDRRGMTESFFVLTVELFRCAESIFRLSAFVNAVEIQSVQCRIPMPVILGRQAIGADVDGNNRGRFLWKETIVREQFESQERRDELERFLWLNCIA